MLNIVIFLAVYVENTRL